MQLPNSQDGTSGVRWHHVLKLRRTHENKESVDQRTRRRQAEGLANGTINREFAALKRMFRLPSQQTPPLVGTTPHIPHLQEHNVRQGFFTEDEYNALWGGPS